jgi:hypothetical protein
MRERPERPPDIPTSQKDAEVRESRRLRSAGEPAVMGEGHDGKGRQRYQADPVFGQLSSDVLQCRLL